MKVRYYFLSVIALMTVAFSCGPEYIGQSPIISISADTELRNGPGPDYDRITTVKAGTQVFLMESENDWHKVRLADGTMGWIFKGITKTSTAEKVVVLQDARIRRGPGEEYSAFAIVKKGKTLDALGTQGNWYQVDLTDGKTGWISHSDAEKVTHRNLIANKDTAILLNPDANAPVMVMVDKGTELIQLKKQGGYYMVRLPGGSTGWIHEDYVGAVKERTLTVKERALIRFGPSVEFDVVGTVERGARLTKLDQRESWYQVRTPQGEVGWIYKDFIQTVAGTQGSVVSEDQPEYVITNSDCNIRQGYGTNWEKIAEVKKGTLLVRIGQKDEWYRVKMPDQRIGWIRQDLVNSNADVLVALEDCNIRLGPSTNYRVKSTVEKGTPLAKISEQDGWSRVYLPNGEIGWIRNDLRADKDAALITNQECNVREGPGTNYTQIDRISKGTSLKEIGRQNEWRQVQLPSGRTGWIREDLLEGTENQLVANERANLRKGPGTEYVIVTEVEKLTPMTLIGEQGDWYKVRLKSGTTGWIRKDLVSYSYYPSVSGTQSHNSPGSGASSSGGSSSSSSSPLYSGVKMKITDPVKIRMGPGTDHPEITTLTTGTEVTRIDQQGEWFEVITRSGTKGFVHQSGFNIGSPTSLVMKQRGNIRRGPSTNFTVLTTLEQGAEVTKIEQRDDWIYVKISNDEKGWIQKDLVGPKTITPLVPSAKPEIGKFVTTEKVNIRKGPGTDYPIVRSVLPNTTVNIIGKHEDWYEVNLITGESGWMFSKLGDKEVYKKIIVTNKTEVHQEPDSESGVLANVEAGEIFDPIATQGSWYRITYKRGDTGWISVGNVAELKYPQVYVNSGTVNIHRNPDKNAPRIAVVKEGIELTPINEEEDWLFVVLPRGDKGWIEKALVNRQKYPRVIIVKETKAYEQPTNSSRAIASLFTDDEFATLDKKDNWHKVLLRGSEIGWVYGGYLKEKSRGKLLVRENSRVRMGPGTDYKPIGNVSAGEQLNWLDEKNNWCQVEMKPKEVGWILVDLAKDITLPPVTASKNASAYAGPGANYAVVGTVKSGTKYSPRTKKNGWYQVDLSNGTQGWIKEDVFTSQKTRVVFTMEKSNIRSGPGQFYEVVEQVEPATDLTIIGIEGDWYYVELQDGKKGYIKKDLVFE
ncbi:MAG: SH3 domain-containing protein [Candidatus Zhuqueibacterota bacterium]